MHVHLPVAVKAIAIPMEYGQVALENKSESSIYGKVSNKMFAVDRGGDLVLGVWSEFENMLFFFSNSLRYTEPNQLDCNTSFLTLVFNSTAKYTSAPLYHQTL